MLRIKENNCFNYQISSILEEDNHLSFLKLIFSAVIGFYYMYIYKHCVYLAPEEVRSEYEVLELEIQMVVSHQVGTGN